MVNTQVSGYDATKILNKSDKLQENNIFSVDSF